MNTAAKIADPSRHDRGSHRRRDYCAFGGWADDQRTLGLVMAVSERYREAAATLGDPWRLSGGSLA